MNLLKLHAQGSEILTFDFLCKLLTLGLCFGFGFWRMFPDGHEQWEAITWSDQVTWVEGKHNWKGLWTNLEHSSS